MTKSLVALPLYGIKSHSHTWWELTHDLNESSKGA